MLSQLFFIPMLANNLLLDPASPGRLRSIGLGIGRSVYSPPSIPQLIAEMFNLILEKARKIRNPFEQAFFVMVSLPYLQPFEDVNKRLSRLAANIPLLKYNFSPLSFVDVPGEIYVQALLGVYELNKIDLLKNVFMWAYDRSTARYSAIRQQVGQPDTFKMQYRERIKGLISEIIIQALDMGKAQQKIEETANQLPGFDKVKFVEAVETELLSIHDGNFARCMARPSEYKKWRVVWTGL